jgi:hypothetical protein
MSELAERARAETERLPATDVDLLHSSCSHRVPRPVKTGASHSTTGASVNGREPAGTAVGPPTFPGRMMDGFIKAVQGILIAGETMSFVAGEGVEVGR